MEYNTGQVYDNSVYYRILRMRNGLMTVACLQNFDEYSYNQDEFVKDSRGEPYYFDSENDAATALRDWYKPSEIDSEYRKNDPFLVR